MFDWCNSEQHDICSREYKVFIVDVKTNKVSYTGEVKKCDCKKRGCPCYVKPADRQPVKKAAKRRRK